MISVLKAGKLKLVEQFFRYTEEKTGRKLLSRRKETEECRDDREKGI